jgi:hypothetical protein
MNIVFYEVFGVYADQKKMVTTVIKLLFNSNHASPTPRPVDHDIA